MKKFYGFLILLICILLLFIGKVFLKKPPGDDSVKGSDSYFFLLPVERYNQTKIPCILIEIEDRAFVSSLDLGFTGCVTLSPASIEELKNKKFLYERIMYKFTGQGYNENVYEIPELSMGNLFFRGNIHLQDGYRDEFHFDSILGRKETVSSLTEDGRIGWKIFEENDLLLDFKNSKIGFCSSINTLKEHGFFLENFAEVPLLLDRGLVEFEVSLSEEVVRCTLDTGCTLNLINRDVEPEDFDSENIEPISVFKIGNEDFGPLNFHPAAIKLPIHIGFTLGMEFLFEHVVFLDFKNLKVYISRATVLVDGDFGGI